MTNFSSNTKYVSEIMKNSLKNKTSLKKEVYRVKLAYVSLCLQVVKKYKN